MNKKNERKASKSRSDQKSILLVLGMHRSGTSALGGVLQHLGCTLPKTLIGESANNPKGHFESQLIRQFNDRVLAAAKSHWDDWMPLNPNWFNSIEGRKRLADAQELLQAEFASAPLVMLKDPRICRMAPFWIEAAEAAEYQVLPVLTHRNPLEVAKSLQKRDGIELGEGLLIWLRHVLEAEAQTRGMTRYVTSYAALLKNWVQVITRLQETLNLTLPRFDTVSATRVETFLEAGLRHFEELPEKISENPTLSIWVRDTFSILERWVESGERKSDHKRLDRILAEFNASVPLFAQLARPPGGSSRAQLQTSLDAERRRSEVLEQRWKTTQDEAAQQAKLADKLQADSEAAQAETAKARAQLEETQAALQTTLGAERRRAADLEQRWKATQAAAAEQTKLAEKFQAESDVAQAEIAKTQAQLKETQTALQTTLEAERRRSADLEQRWKTTQDEAAQQTKLAEKFRAESEAAQAEIAKAQAQLEEAQAAAQTTLDTQRRRSADLEQRWKTTLEAAAQQTKLADKLQAESEAAQAATAKAQAQLKETQTALQASLDAERRRSEVLEQRWKATLETAAQQTKLAEKFQADSEATQAEIAKTQAQLEETQAAAQTTLEAERLRSADLEQRWKTTLEEAEHQKEQGRALQKSLDQARNDLGQSQSAVAQRRLEADQAQERAASAAARAEDLEGQLLEREDRLRRAEAKRQEELLALAEARANANKQSKEHEWLTRQLSVSHEELAILARILADLSQDRDQARAQLEATQTASLATLESERRRLADLEQRWKATQETAAQQTQRAEKLQAESEAAQTEIATAQAQLKETQAALQANLEAERRRSAELEQRWRATQDEVAQQTKLAEKLQADYDAAQAATAKVQAQIEETQTALQAALEAERRRSADLEQRWKTTLEEAEHQKEQGRALQKSLDQARNDLGQSQSAVAQRRLEADQAQERAASAAARAEDLESQLREREDRLRRAETQRQKIEAENAGRLATLSVQIQTEAATKAKLEAERNILHGNLISLEDSLQKAQEQLREFGRKTDEADQSRTATAREAEKRQAQITHLSSEIEALRNSTSWRTTKPLRALVDWLRAAR